MALLFCSVELTLAWQGPLGAKMKPRLLFLVPDWHRLPLFPALAVLAVKLLLCFWAQVKSGAACLLFITLFGFVFWTSPPPFCHPNSSPLLHPHICCSFFLVFLCEGWIFSKKLQSNRFSKCTEREPSAKTLWEKADRHTHGGKTPQGSVPILYMYNKLRCF